MERYYTVNEIAEMFKVTRTTVYDWMNTGKLKWVQVGARRRVTQTTLEDFVKAGSGSGQTSVKSEEIQGPGLAPQVVLAR